MAFGAKKIFPLDTRPGVGIGVKIPFNNPGVFSSTYTTQESIKNNLINFFLTNQGEIYLNPNFGGDLRSFIFQQITDDNLEELKEEIQSKITQYFPSVIVDSLDVFQSTDIYQINIILKYNIQNTGLTDTLEIAFT
jgi:phage baseplate assembly protein W